MHKSCLCKVQKHRNLHQQLSPVFLVQVDIGGFGHEFEMYCQGNPVADCYNQAVCNSSIKECHSWLENSLLSCTSDTLTAQEKAK